jgi:hypothetical protein
MMVDGLHFVALWLKQTCGVVFGMVASETGGAVLLASCPEADGVKGLDLLN